MFTEIFKDVFTRFGATILKWLAVAIVVLVAILALKSCAPWSYEKKLERAVEKQNETIKELAVNNQTETASAENDRKGKQESLDRLVEHTQKQAEDKATFKEIETNLDKQLKPRPPTVTVKAKPKPQVSKPSPRVLTSIEEIDEETMQEAKRTQHNLRVSHEAMMKAYEKALEMSASH